MSFLWDTNLLIEGSIAGQNGRRIPRKSRSHAALLSSFVQLLSEPGRSIIPSLYSNETAVESEVERKQVLYLRLRNVSLVHMSSRNEDASNATAG